MTQATATAAPPRRWWILAVIGVAQLMVILDNSIVNIALPSAQADLGFSDAQRQWVVTAYALAFGSLLLLGGRLSDLFGRKAAFVVGLIGFAVASVLGGLAPGFGLLVAARALQGVFGAVLAPAALSLLTTTFPAGRDRARAFGVFSALAGSGAAIGLLLGGTLTEYADWRWCMYVNVVFAVIALVGALLLMPAHPSGERPRLDLVGTVLASAGLFGVVFGFATAETDGWGSWPVYAFLTAGVVLLAVFVAVQRVRAAPLLPLRVLLDRYRGGSYLTILVLTTGMFGLSLFLAYVMQTELGLSPVLTGVAFLPMVASIMTASTTVPAIVLPRVGPKPLIFVGLLLGAGALFWFSQLSPGSTYVSGLLGPLILMGLGMGTAMSTSINTATLGVDPQDAGVASATVNTMQQVGGSVGTALLSSIAGTATALGVGLAPRAAALAGYDRAFLVASAIFVVAAVVCGLLVPAGRPHATVADSGPAPRELESGSSWGGPDAVDAPTGTIPVAADDRRAAAPGLSGRVLDGAAPVDGTVTLIDALTGTQVGTTRTDGGRYHFEVPRAGDYLLVVSAAGRRPFAERVRVAAPEFAVARDVNA
ncbi:MFS transporter [Actinomycetospora corticicola]|uniref:EmrB/QacA subfamily drug resistance transporter n=1 Tax=Actinomycetospora corticicola TaxID=663602 RepID=A0A7Y9DT50_9PSEU|nr:EmrB/QacA subfamily drug resistance transporter [Actinomycetospora corticicola]